MGEEIVINGNIRVVVLEAQRDRVRLGVVAPPSVRVNRLEVQMRDHPEPTIIEPARIAHPSDLALAR
jgi:carbon storage regulator CsrA